MDDRPVKAFDLETHPFAPGNMAPKPVCFSIAESSGAHGIEARVVDPDTGYRWLGDHLEQAIAGRVTLTGHGVDYDFACVLEHGPESLRDLVWRAYEADGVRCTYVDEKLIDIARGEMRGTYDNAGKWIEHDYNLGDLALRHFKKKLDKGAEGFRLRFGELDGTPIADWPKHALDYARDDAGVDLALSRFQRDRARKMGYKLPTSGLEARAALALRLTSVWGIRTDEERVVAIDKSTKARMVELADKLCEYGIARRKGKGQRRMFADATGSLEEAGELTKNMEKIRHLVESTWPTVLELTRTPSGLISTAAEVLEMCAHPALEALVEYVSLEKQGSTYIAHLYDGIEQAIHAAFDVLGAASSRTSCRKPNLQNPPRLVGVRECYLPRPGTVYVCCDYSAQESRTFAQAQYDLTGRSLLGDRFQANPLFDPHLEFAADKILRVVVKDAELRYAAGDVAVEDARQRAKIANFGLPGGLGIPGLVRFAKGYGVTLSAQEAKELIAFWTEKWQTDAYFATIRAQVGSANYGRAVIAQSGFWRGGVGYTDACNTQFQSLAAHASKAALFEVARRCYNVPTSYLYGSRIVNFVHDEIVLETPEEWAHEAALELQAVMVECQNRFTPKVPAAASPTVTRRWSKKAKAVRDAGGRLIPWDDVKRAA